MKSYKIYFLLLALLACSSCEDFLTEIPETAVPEAEAMTNLNAAEEVVVGIYSCLKNSSLYSGALVQASDIQSDIFNFVLALWNCQSATNMHITIF